MISIICVYNDRKILDNNIMKSLEKQNTDYELILIDNTENKFTKAADALNYGAKNAKGEFLMFLHHDIELLSDTWLKDVEKVLCSLKDLGVAGVAGFPENVEENVMISNIKDGYPPEDVGVHIDKPTEVQTVDECLFIIPRSVFNDIQFDAVTCPNWHLYAVDYCLNVKKHGLSVYVLPFEVYHVSRSYSFSTDYYTTLKNVIGKYRSSYNQIYTTCGVWRTSGFRLLLNIYEDKILRKLNMR